LRQRQVTLWSLLNTRPASMLAFQVHIALFVLLFSHGYGFEDECHVIQSLLAGDLCKIGIHGGPFVVLAAGGLCQVVDGGADYAGGKCTGDLNLAAFQQFEQPFGMLFFLVGGLFENICNLYEPFFPGLLGKVGVTVSGLRFTSKAPLKCSFPFVVPLILATRFPPLRWVGIQFAESILGAQQFSSHQPLAICLSFSSSASCLIL
jgi:hypothetical protein